MAETLGRAGQAEAALEVVTEALAVADRSGERFYAAELHWLRGELLLAAAHDPAGAAECLGASLAIERQQGARTLARGLVLRQPAWRGRTARALVAATAPGWSEPQVGAHTAVHPSEVPGAAVAVRIWLQRRAARGTLPQRPRYRIRLLADRGSSRCRQAS